jgi:hypothetical protein
MCVLAGLIQGRERRAAFLLCFEATISAIVPFSGATDCRSARHGRSETTPAGNRLRVLVAARALHAGNAPSKDLICIGTGAIGAHWDSRRHRPVRPFPHPPRLAGHELRPQRKLRPFYLERWRSAEVWRESTPDPAARMDARFPNRTAAIESTIHARRLFFMVQRSVTLWP